MPRAVGSHLLKVDGDKAARKCPVHGANSVGPCGKSDATDTPMALLQAK